MRVQMRKVYFPIPLDERGGQVNFLAPNDHQVKVICTGLQYGDPVNPGIVEFARDADLRIHEAR